MLDLIGMHKRRCRQDFSVKGSFSNRLKRQSKDGRMTRIDLREPKKEMQMVMIGFRRLMEELGKGV